MVSIKVTDLSGKLHDLSFIGARLGVDARTIRDDIGKNSKLGKISVDLGPGWNEALSAKMSEIPNLEKST